MTEIMIGETEATAPLGREAWRTERLLLESSPSHRRHTGRAIESSWLFGAAVRQFGRALRLTPMWERGLRNAADIAFTRVELAFSDLPPVLAVLMASPNRRSSVPPMGLRMSNSMVRSR